MEKEKVIKIIKKRFGDSDEDLADLEIIMDAIEGIDRADYLEREIATVKLENEKALADLDATWRKRYRDRFFNGDSDLEDVIDRMETDEREAENAEITLEEFIDELREEKRD